MYAIAVHGGAGDWPVGKWGQVSDGVSSAAAAGRAILAEGGGALDAVVHAVSLLEDHPLFNAGTGSVLNLDGHIEMDAGVMISEYRRCGNVAAIMQVQNPIKVARDVMEHTPHVLLVGEGANRFARSRGYPAYDPCTSERRKQWEKGRKQAESLIADPWRSQDGNTVGAVAMDASGCLAAATSTGGTFLQLPGRVGDTPIPGAGLYASPDGAASATGLGELMMRGLTCFQVIQYVGMGKAAGQAAPDAIAWMSRNLGADVGLVVVDRTGGVGIAHGTPSMPHAYATELNPVVTARVRCGGT